MTSAADSKSNFFSDIINTRDRKNKLKESFKPDDQKKILLERINQWKSDSVKKIEATAAAVAADVEKRFREANNRFTTTLGQVDSEFQKMNETYSCDAKMLENLKRLLDTCEEQMNSLKTIKYVEGKLPLIHQISVDGHVQQPVSSYRAQPVDMTQTVPSSLTSSRPVSYAQSRTYSSYIPIVATAPLRQPMIFTNQTTMRKEINDLFKKLDDLFQTNRHQLIESDFATEIKTMKDFLQYEFGFTNIKDQPITENIAMFRLSNPPETNDPKKVIRYFSKSFGSFSMTIEKIIKWQNTYAVYAIQNIGGLTKEFIRLALKGGSRPGAEAFRMKFIVSISTCPILMDFDGNVINRNLSENWPDRIKLVTATGIDFAGRQHDIQDILTYVTNWRDIFEIDPVTGDMRVDNDRCFIIKPGAPNAILDEKLLQDDLIAMARLRLQACDREKVAVVIETGVGLGVFSGARLYIDDVVRKASAAAIRQVLATDGASYKNILAVVFSLPIRSLGSSAYSLSKNIYNAFVDEFSRSNYSGPIPVMIIDQDVHPLALSIAKAGFCVSELSPSDSVGVFGGYWQLPGTSFSGKLAVTTLGLLVQHHLINKAVVDQNRYHLV